MKHLIHNKDYTKEVNSLMDFAQKKMGFSNSPEILFSNDPDNASKPLGKTAYYNPNNAKITIFVTSRHVKDILRSLAHELVHHMQNEQGSLHSDGYMGAGYAQKNSKMREMERQAYEMGNLCFRDWEDSLKQNYPTIYNERRNRKMSLKDWKNKELMENLFQKWGFKSKLNENIGTANDRDVDVEIDADADTEDLLDTPPPMPSNPEGLSFQEQKEYDLEESQDRIFAPSHYCAHHVVHEGKKGYTVDHNYNTILKRVTRYDVKFGDGSVKRNIHENKLTVLEAFSEGEHKRDDHPKVKEEKEESPMERAERIASKHGLKEFGAVNDLVDFIMKNKEASDSELVKMHKEKRKVDEAKEMPMHDHDDDPSTPEVPSFVSKAEDSKTKGKQSKETEKSEDSDKKESPKKGKMPPGLAKYQAEKKGKMKESLNRKIRVSIKK